MGASSATEHHQSNRTASATNTAAWQPADSWQQQFDADTEPTGAGVHWKYVTSGSFAHGFQYFRVYAAELG